MRKNDGDPRPIGQLRALTHAELILRPWDTSRPAVTAVLTVTAPLPSLTGAGVEPGEVNGRPITAAHVRELLAQLDAVCPGGLQAPTGGSLQVAVTDADGALLATASRAELERIARRGCASTTRSAAATAAARCWTGRRRSTATGPPRRSAASARPGTAPAASPAAGSRSPGSTSTTSSRMPRRRDRLRQPLLSVPPAPPAQDLRTRVAVRPHPRRAAPGHDSERDHPHHPATGPARPHRATGPARTTPTTRGTAAVLRRVRPLGGRAMAAERRDPLARPRV